MKTKKLPKWAVWASLLTVLPIAACMPPADDAGDVSFVIQATQLVLGRKPRGTAEVQSLLAILQNPAQGRGAVIDVLMEEPDFVEYWLPVLADSMQVQRKGDFAQDESCFSGPIYMVDAAGAPCATSACAVSANALANHIRDDIPKQRVFDPDGNGTSNNFNMNDALRAAILADDLHVAWRPWLFSLAARHGTAGLVETRDNFMVSAFNVTKGCVSCHSSIYSKTEVYPDTQYGVQYGDNDWDRTAVLGWDLEETVFGNHTSLDLTEDPSCTRTGAAPAIFLHTFQNKCSSGGCHGANGTNFPSVGGGTSPKRLTARVPLLSDDEIVSQILNGNENMPAIDLDNDGVTGFTDADDVTCANSMVAFFRKQLGGYTDFGHYLDAAQFVDPSTAPAPACAPGAPPPVVAPGTVAKGPWGMACGFAWTENRVCDAGGKQYFFAGTARQYTDVANVTSSLKAGLAALPTESTSAPVSTTADPLLPSTSTPDVSVAMLIAENIADDLLFEVSGDRTTVAHGMPRTTGQAVALKYLVSTMLVDDGTHVRISLKNGVKTALLTTFFNRTTPAYDFDMYVNPWAATDPSSAIPPDPTKGDNLNGLGDLVHRRSPNQLLWSLHQDLGWAAPPVYVKSNSIFPTAQFEEEIGRYKSPTLPTNPVWDLNSFTILESQIGLCANADAPHDWIWQLAEGTFNGTVQACTPACATPTIRQLLLGTKDRLIQEPAFDAVAQNGVVEETAARTFATGELGAIPACVGDILDCSATLWPKATVKTMLRKYCGGLVMTPDYLLANLPTATAAYSLPAVTVCLPGQICQKADFDAHYATALCTLHYTCP